MSEIISYTFIFFKKSHEHVEDFSSYAAFIAMGKEGVASTMIPKGKFCWGMKQDMVFSLHGANSVIFLLNIKETIMDDLIEQTKTWPNEKQTGLSS